MSASTVRFSTFPGTEPPPDFVEDVVGVFRQHEGEIATETNAEGLKSDDVLAVFGPQLASLGFQVEASKKKADKLERPVFFGKTQFLLSTTSCTLLSRGCVRLWRSRSRQLSR